MNLAEFDQIDRFAVHLEDLLEKAIRDGSFGWLQKEMEKAVRGLPPEVSLRVKMKVELVHEDRENALRLSSMGFSAAGTGSDPSVQPHADPLFDGATMQTYEVLGNLHRAPHDVCPNCWAPWSDKMSRLRCPHCFVEMGKEVRVVVEKGLCPNCEQGKVSPDDPVCPGCNRRIDPSCVVWR